jgi:hypothetical protein
VKTINKNYLDELRANADEVREDLANRERLAEEDHEQIMASVSDILDRNITRAAPTLVYKTCNSTAVKQDILDVNGDDQPPIFDENQTEIIAEVLAEVTSELKAAIDDAVAPLVERVSRLEGQVDLLVALFGDTNKSFEASEVIRKMRVQR